MLFIADDPSAAYLTFEFKSSTANGVATLSVPTDPQNVRPGAVPSNLTLVRPDGKKPASSRLKPPPTPTAPPNAFVKADLSTDLPAAPAGSAMGSKTGGIAISHLGTTPTYGADDATRIPAAGQKFIGFETTAFAGDNATNGDLTTSAVVSVDHGSEQPMPTGAGSYYILSVPTSVTSVDLVLYDSGYNQSLSLLDGKPAATNITVLGRNTREATSITTTYPVNFVYSPSVVFADGTHGTAESGTIAVKHIDLAYQATVNGTATTASSPANALAFFDITVNYQHDPAGGAYAMTPGLVSFTPAGGAAIP